MTCQAVAEQSLRVAGRWPLLVEASSSQATGRSGTGGRSAAAWPTPIPPPSCRAAVLALDGRLTLAGPSGPGWWRRGPSPGALTTAKALDEVLTVALPPTPPRTGACFLEVVSRR